MISNAGRGPYCGERESTNEEKLSEVVEVVEARDIEVEDITKNLNYYVLETGEIPGTTRH